MPAANSERNPPLFRLQQCQEQKRPSASGAGTEAMEAPTRPSVRIRHSAQPELRAGPAD